MRRPVGGAGLNLQLGVHRHVVTQVVEAKFVVGAVEDVGAIGISPRHRHQVGETAAAHVRQLGIVEVRGIVLEAAHGEPEQVIDGPHPHRITSRQVVVDGYDVHAVAGDRVEKRRQRRHQGLAFAGFHL